MANPAGKCIFCGYTGKLTGEHVFSRWTHSYVPKTSRSHKRLFSTTFPDRSDFKLRKKSGDVIDWKVQCVCGGCNNGWMRKKLEDIARPIMLHLIKGEGCRISPEQQRYVAAWAFLKLIIAEADPYGSRTTVHHTYRKRLMNLQLAPENGLAVWIGHFKRGTWPVKWASTPFLHLEKEQLARRADPVATYYNSAIVTQVIGELFIQSIYTPNRRLVRDWRWSLPDRGTLFRIWPRTRTDILWPAKTMTDRDADFTAAAISRALAKIATGNA